MINLDKLKEANEERWNNAKLTRDFSHIARILVAAKPRYERVQAVTGVPWFVVAVIHERESSQSWDSQLAQGDPLGEKSIHVPAGRGPFATWEGGAFDALVNCHPYAARNKDWSVGGTLTKLEEYNGLGYANKGIPSPYVWSGTNIYTKGKYTSDGHYDPDKVDLQPGCAALILHMMDADPTIQFKQPEAKPQGLVDRIKGLFS